MQGVLQNATTQHTGCAALAAASGAAAVPAAAATSFGERAGDYVSSTYR